MKKYLI